MEQSLKLEWVQAKTLTENPLNWRRHPDAQLSTLRDVINDPDVGWAGALLWNSATKRLIDGHGRLKVVKPDEYVPVLVGSWSEDAEKKILATLDPLAGMAVGDDDAYRKLVESFTTDSLWVRELIRTTDKTNAALAAKLEKEDEAGAKGEPEDGHADLIAEMELQPFEHYDYVVLIFRDDQDFQGACEKLGIDKVQVSYAGGLKKIGLGRVVDGAKAMTKLAGVPA